MPTEGNKKCSLCGKIKPLSDFYKDSSLKSPEKCLEDYLSKEDNYGSIT